MTEIQRSDWAHHEQKLILLLLRRQNLPLNSDQRTDLLLEIASIENLVHSYRVVYSVGA
jgi:hypothetical protein